MTIGGVDYDILEADLAAKATFTSTVQEQLASSVGLGVTPDLVSVSISRGSVMVMALIQVQDGEVAEAVSSHLQRAGFGELEAALSAHPDLQAAITGPPSAVVIDVQVTDVEGESSEGLESCAVAGGLGAIAGAAVLATVR